MTYNAGILDKVLGAERTQSALYTKFAAYSAKASTQWTYLQESFY